MKDFDESKVKRDKEGKFAPKDTPAEQKRLDELSGGDKYSPKQKAIAEKLGKEFVGFKGIDAIEKLLIEKQGHIKAAFHHNEIGDIDILWGDPDPNKGYGLSHIIQRRDKTLKERKGKVSGIEMVRRIPQILEKGSFMYNKNRKRFEVVYGENLVIIAPNLEGNSDIKWILTAYEIN